MVSSKLMTAEEFASLPENNVKTELIEGERIEMSPTGTRHLLVVSELVRLLVQYANGHPGVRVLVGEGGYLLHRNPDTVLAPDIAIITDEQMRSLSPQSDAFTSLAPTLVVEVKSPSDREAQIARKLSLYLAAGVKEVWWVRPQQRQVSIHRQDLAPEIIFEGALESTEILPGFRLPLSELFAQ
jgi:Uma2 family endonuclease